MENPFEPTVLAAHAVSARLTDSNEYVRIVALAELLRGGAGPAPLIEALAACLGDSSLAVRELATVALGQSGAPAVTALTQALDERQPASVRVAAASGLSRVGGEASSAIDELCKCLASADELLRWHAGFALSKMGRAAVAPLQALLSSSNPALVCAVVNALGWIGGDARTAGEAIKALASSSPPTQSLACHSAMVRITGDSSAGLPAILNALKNQDADVRRFGLQSLGELGLTVNQSSAQILPLDSDPSSVVRAEAALALARMGATDPQTVQTLINLLGDSDGEVRLNAAIGLAKLTPTSQEAQSALQTLQAEKDPRLTGIVKAGLESVSKAG